MIQRPPLYRSSLRRSTSSLIVMIQTNTKRGEGNTVRNRMSDDEAQIKVILSESSQLPQFRITIIMEYYFHETTGTNLLLQSEPFPEASRLKWSGQT